MKGLRICLTFRLFGDPPNRPMVRTATFLKLENGMARCTLTLSAPSVPAGASPVTERHLVVTDGTGAEFTVLLDGDVTQTTADNIPDLNVTHDTPGSCYLVDVNADGESIPSTPFTLDPGAGPTPPAGGVPDQPSILAVQWLDQPQGSQSNVVDCRRGRR